MKMSTKKRTIIMVLALVIVCTVLAGFVVPLLAEQPADYKPLVGQWVRTSGGYVLDIRNVQPDGKMELAYFNPRPINVSKAQANIETGRIKIFVELRDKYYPGSYYTLTYDPQSDRLVGVYHHLGIGQNMNVFFSRKPNAISVREERR